MPLIAVEGRAVRFQRAERGTLTVGVSFSGEAREPVLEHARRTHGRLVDEAKAHTDAGTATWWGADGVAAWAFHEWVKPEPHLDSQKVLRFRASSRIRVKFRDFSVLSTWASAVAERTGVSLDGVEWALTDTTRVTLTKEVRRSAALDARARASEYASALGLGEVRLVTLYEAGLRPDVGSRPGPTTVAARGAAASSTKGSGFELRPDDIEVTAAVSADYDAA
ncbi:SIMPL domain-containing protein [Luteimicrobium sp. NPDC057192]|uniref:SIMPL domain-containing protein n=1 Tax=Luteimicrobium sp. NPDC057192 TaxID=3346042 RepID=UPI0036416B34